MPGLNIELFYLAAGLPFYLKKACRKHGRAGLQGGSVFLLH
jgi:hypothetical protein